MKTKLYNKLCRRVARKGVDYVIATLVCKGRGGGLKEKNKWRDGTVYYLFQRADSRMPFRLYMATPVLKPCKNTKYYCCRSKEHKLPLLS